MIGALAASKKAAKYGYKVYGVPGAVVAGAGGAAGVVAAKKGMETVVDVDAGAETDSIAPEEGTEIEVEFEDDAEFDGRDEFDDPADPGSRNE